MKSLSKFFLGFVAFLPMLVWAAAPVRVACIGNSITYGYALVDPASQSYPSQLQVMLDSIAPGQYVVGNFGRSGATLLRKGHRPYNEMEEYQAAIEFRPDIAVIHLGINDTDPRDWPYHNTHFVSDYLQLIDSLKAVNPEMRIIIANLTPIRAMHPRFGAGTREWRLKVRDAIKDVAAASGCELIDFERPLVDRQNLLHDGLHPDIEGSNLLAREAFGGITGQWGGLKMSAVYTDSMIVQRDRHFPVRGRADAGKTVNVNIGGRNYSAVADNRGDWVVTVAPLVVGDPYTLTVTDGSDTLRFSDILAGEVWIASGQSNMAFTLGESVDAEEALAESADPLLRFFDMKPRAVTNSKEWPEEVRNRVGKLDYYLPSAWHSAAASALPKWSAVAYHFAKSLRDSLQVPVGIICNAIGGAPTEAWIDMTFLEAAEPGIIVGWPKNHFVQEWVGRRANENAVDAAVNCHPYMPGYLFATGIRPLGKFPAAGVIWYQGESNEQNVELHERLFAALLQSWRSYFENPELPVHYVQLSSLSRPSWPEFRDSQRRMSERLPNVAMAVSSDHGDSLDVHPRNKRPVGQRLARTALRNVYGHEIVSSGPAPASALAQGSSVVLTMDFADGLTTSDGLSPRFFEVAEVDGVYYPADAEISDNKIILNNMDVTRPRYVRYGWQPFTRSNVINSDSLPASTFKIEVDNAADYEPEPGIEVGVSACYAGRLGDKLIMAGGCNFPTDPIAPDSRKKFYKGIYVASVEDPALQWRRVGSLPGAMAYGGTAAVSDALIIVGGTDASHSLSSVYRLMLDDADRVVVDSLPSLPFAVDNMGVAAIGNKIYMAGVSAEATPSFSLLMLDLDHLSDGWRQLKPIPGNLRVQPAMVTAVNADGEECLYLWGGFAPKRDGKNATLNTDGLCYIPSKDKWRKLSSPADADGVELTLSGGSASLLSDGSVMAVGGVNKDVFLEALRCQASDYLQHPVEWYRFNPNVLVFDPKSEKWTVVDVNPDAARAGAVAVAGKDNDIYLIGGELKPRIRTPYTLHIRK